MWWDVFWGYVADRNGLCWVSLRFLKDIFEQLVKITVSHREMMLCVCGIVCILLYLGRHMFISLCVWLILSLVTICVPVKSHLWNLYGKSRLKPRLPHRDPNYYSIPPLTLQLNVSFSICSLLHRLIFNNKHLREMFILLSWWTQGEMTHTYKGEPIFECVIIGRQALICAREITDNRCR